MTFVVAVDKPNSHYKLSDLMTKVITVGKSTDLLIFAG